ncbi:gephyrin-like molybdotransferase Glp [Pararobbsia silviterrae]|uniref:Molybdopterin molybdenumtransferase n=1 Tax=Pararobbsia silviterrae TaxID=1792498 RepID=A0A494Y0D4_9BURK|nr:gephyrin-like molybdotransferase Glp [Pararobbsia silviterrae]RKP55709.1 molybdopterin molybdenumtransferase MoeA [Pararobbsia silviterrae]
MLDFDLAQQRLVEDAPLITRTERVSLAQARGRVLAQTVVAGVDLPPGDNSAMDGYALRYIDYADARAMPIQQRCYAGDAPAPLIAGQATRVFTGSLVPAGADTVVMQEHAVERDGQVTFTEAPRNGQHVRLRGEDIRTGQVLLRAGTLIGPAHIALIASQGLASVEVFERLRVGILTTGDELVAPGEPRTAQQIYNSNAAMLAALVEGMGAQVAHLMHARDTETALRDAFASLIAGCDLVLSVGGVSVGDRDLVKPVLESLGGNLALWKVRMKPGKPMALARVGGKPVVCLPGNPGSVFAVFVVMVTPLIRRMQARDTVFPIVSNLPLRTARTLDESREVFLRVAYQLDTHGAGELIPYGSQGAGNIGTMIGASGLARLAAGVPIADRDLVAYYDLERWLA